MWHKNLSYSIQFDLNNIDLLRFDVDREYQRIISPFTRLYLIVEGTGWIKIEGEKIILEPGYLYLIPSFRTCSYHFCKGLVHYYVHFNAQANNGINTYNLYKTIRKVKAIELDYKLFERLLSINPGIEIPHHDPKIYQTKEWMNRKFNIRSTAHYNENRGILEQLFSRFILNEETMLISDIVRYNLAKIMDYIQANLSEPIEIKTLADMACLSRDHFIKVFKKAATIPPGAYIISKRVESAQFLLLTTDLPIKKIIEETGFKSFSYFSRVFKKHTYFSPMEYKKFRQ